MRTFSHLTSILLVSVVTLFLSGYADQCEAKSWADIVAQSPPKDTVSTATTKPHPDTKKQQPLPKAQQRQQLPPGVHRQLPSDAVQYRVRNVYDGDTLTLLDADENRVRLIGIDTPEISEKQPFAQEAKKYTKLYCHKKDIYLSFDENGERRDKYGRLIAYVWVPLHDTGLYLCVNEGIVAEGLATVYLASKEFKPRNFKQLLRLQQQARAQKKGIWRDFVDYNVVVTRYGAAFHKNGCRHIARSKGLKTMRATEATDKGLHPCRTCLADK